MSSDGCKNCGRPVDLFCQIVDGICQDEEWGHVDADGFEIYFDDCRDPEEQVTP